MKVLIAEDDVTSRTMLVAMLGKWGYDVASTADGEEAWTAMQKSDAPQLAVLDWVMPGMTGPELCRALRRQDRPAPLYLLLVTSKGEREDMVEGLLAGADDYIPKPYDSAELRARVHVGQRMVELQNTLLEKEKFQGVLEMAGAVCHELHQPLQCVLGFSELLLMDMREDDPKYPTLKKIKAAVQRTGELTHKMMRITRYRSKEYLPGAQRIIDIEEASIPDS